MSDEVIAFARWLHDKKGIANVPERLVAEYRATALTSGGEVDGLFPRVCTDPECPIPRRPGRPMHGPHDFRAASKETP